MRLLGQFFKLFIFLFLQKDFARSKSTESTKSTKSTKTQPSKSTKRYNRTVRVWWSHYTNNSASVYTNKDYFFGTV